MNRSPLVWTLAALAAHAAIPGALWLLLESERPGEGLARALRAWPFATSVGYAPSVSAFVGALVWRTNRGGSPRRADRLVGWVLLLDASALGIAWALAQGRIAPLPVVPMLPLLGTFGILSGGLPRHRE